MVFGHTLYQYRLGVLRIISRYRRAQDAKNTIFPRYTLPMRNEFTAVIERDGEWFVGWSPEIPGANGQGSTVEECRESLGAAIQLILEENL